VKSIQQVGNKRLMDYAGKEKFVKEKAPRWRGAPFSAFFAFAYCWFWGATCFETSPNSISDNRYLSSLTYFLNGLRPAPIRF